MFDGDRVGFVRRFIEEVASLGGDPLGMNIRDSGRDDPNGYPVVTMNPGADLERVIVFFAARRVRGPDSWHCWSCSVKSGHRMLEGNPMWECRAGRCQSPGEEQLPRQEILDRIYLIQARQNAR